MAYIVYVHPEQDSNSSETLDIITHSEDGQMPMQTIARGFEAMLWTVVCFKIEEKDVVAKLHWGFRQENRESSENTHKMHSAVSGHNSTESTMTSPIIFADLITIARNVPQCAKTELLG